MGGFSRLETVGFIGWAILSVFRSIAIIEGHFDKDRPNIALHCLRGVTLIYLEENIPMNSRDEKSRNDEMKITR